MALSVGDKASTLFDGLSGFWQAFFKDSPDLVAYYQAAEVYLGQVYLDLMAAVLNVGAVDTPVFNKEAWKLFAIRETELNFRAGVTANDNRYHYDMPGDIVSIDFMQNTIFQPEVLLEKGDEFFVEDNDGLVRFVDDPFRAYQDATGEWMPIPGVAWRTIRTTVGNRFYNYAHSQYGAPSNDVVYDAGVRKGDTLRLMAQRGPEIVSGAAGSIVKIPSGFMFYGTGVEQLESGDVISVYAHDGGAGHADDAYRDDYVVKSIFKNPPIADQVTLEPLSVHNDGPAGSTTNLSWRGYRAVYYETYQDYEVDYIDKLDVVGSSDSPYPLDARMPFVYSFVRTPAQSQVYGAQLNLVTDPGPLNPPTLPYPGGYSPANPPPGYITELGYRHIDRGSVTIYAVKADGSGERVEEGIDYTVDYIRGRIIQLTYWRDGSSGKADFSYKEEVYLSGAGTAEEKTIGAVKQLSFWVPEVIVDRFTLYNNYGYLLNRFENSSESYKNFILGVMYLYATGPILQRIEAALNVAAGYPVIKLDGEILQGYDSGIVGEGSLASITATNTVTLSAGEYVLAERDVGGFIVFPDPVNSANEGTFRIVGVDIPTNTATLETVYDLVTENPVNWKITLYGVQTVTTDRRSYQYAFNVPMREDVQNSDNFGVLSFVAFEPLTTGFLVTDYLEDPHWWHDHVIPEVLWPVGGAEGRKRRQATAQLYEHIVGAEDLAAIGDPGLYLGADESGIVLSPNDNSGGIGVGDPVSTHRHNVAFVLFDQFLKMQMFYIEISAELELDAQFKEDLEEVVLIAKPSYTYPSVERNDFFIDNVVLTDVFSIPEIIFDFDQAGEPNSIQLANNELIIGDPEFPWNIADFFSYSSPSGAAAGGPVANPLPSGTVLDVGSGLAANQRLINLRLNLVRTSDGAIAVEGRDYVVHWLYEKPPLSANPAAWSVELLVDCDVDGGPPPATFFGSAVDLTQGVYDTTLGHTPLTVGGTNPWYIRHTALDPDSPDYAEEWAALRTEFVDRPIQLTIDDSGGSYTYP